MRLFVAVELHEEVLTAAEALISDVRGRAARLAPAARITWLTRERLHLTLAFIGELPESQMPPLVIALGEAADSPAFAIRIAGLGAFPPRGRPRVLWAGITEGHDLLVAAASRVAAALSSCGVRSEERPFRPHLTLARVREPAALRADALFAGLEATVVGSTPVGAITLFQSRLSPAGSQYGVLARVPLRDGGRPSA